MTNLESSALKRRTKDHAMTSTITKPDSAQPAAEKAVDLFDKLVDPIETKFAPGSREFIEELMQHGWEQRVTAPTVRWRRPHPRAPLRNST